MRKVRPSHKDFCVFCNLAFISLKDVEEAKLTKAGWAHISCIEKALRRAS